LTELFVGNGQKAMSFRRFRIQLNGGSAWLEHPQDAPPREAAFQT
jgi:hypothetical protein